MPQLTQCQTLKKSDVRCPNSASQKLSLKLTKTTKKRRNMLRSILVLASLPLMAAPFISLGATPSAAASLHTQQQLKLESLSDSNSSKSVLIADRDHDRDYYRDHYRERDRDYRQYYSSDYNNDYYRRWYDNHYQRDYDYRWYYNHYHGDYDQYYRWYYDHYHH